MSKSVYVVSKIYILKLQIKKCSVLPPYKESSIQSVGSDRDVQTQLLNVDWYLVCRLLPHHSPQGKLTTAASGERQ